MKAMQKPVASAAIATGLLLAGSAFVIAEDAHHPKDSPQAAETAPQPKQADPGKGMGMLGDRMMGGGMMGKMMGSGGMMGMMGNCPAHKTADALKNELGITDAQKGAWELVAAAQAKLQASMPMMQKSAAKVMEAKSPLERLDAHIGILDERLTSLKDLKGAVSALYATLSDEQKKKADTALNGIGCMM